MLYFTTNAQLIDNRIDLSLGVGYISFFGDRKIKEDNFISPSLYPNYSDLRELSFKVLVKQNKLYSLGLSLNSLDASGWKNSGSSLYDNSKIKQVGLSPVMQIHTKFTEIGVFNRIKIFLEIAPTIGLSELALSNQLFDIQDQNGSVPQPMDSRDLFYGIKSNVGFELSLTRAFGLYFSYSIQQNWVKSKLYNDSKFSYSNLGLGLVVRLEKNKRFYY
jgi:hypothetical protein